MRDNKGAGMATYALIAIIIVVVVVAAVGLFILKDKDEANIVYDINISASEEFDLYVYFDDNEVFFEKNMDPGSYERGRNHYHSMVNDIDTMTIKAVAKDKDGNVLDEDSKTIDVQKDGDYQVDLYLEF